MSTKRFLTVKDVVKRLQIGERTVYRYVEEGKIKAVKIGGWRITEEDLQAFIKRSSNARK